MPDCGRSGRYGQLCNQHQHQMSLRRQSHRGRSFVVLFPAQYSLTVVTRGLNTILSSFIHSSHQPRLSPAQYSLTVVTRGLNTIHSFIIHSSHHPRLSPAQYNLTLVIHDLNTIQSFIHLISPDCPRPSMALQCRIMAQNVNHFISSFSSIIGSHLLSFTS